MSSDEYELPAQEALLAGTLALMTGYGQALQAERGPMQRLAINLRIAHNLEQLSQQASLSPPFRALSERLAALWQSMARCTADACATNETDAASQACAGCAPAPRLH